MPKEVKIIISQAKKVKTIEDLHRLQRIIDGIMAKKER